MARRRWFSLLWAVGARLPHRLRDLISRLAGAIVGLRPVASIPAWEANVALITGTAPTLRQRQQLVTNWCRNNLMSLSLSRWSREAILQRALIDPADEQKLHDSLAGPGCILALPHMGSWDFAGAWCTQVGIEVVSVAERLPDGVFERFRDARAGMGMRIHPVDQPDLMRQLTEHVRQGRMVCLLSDRDLGERGVPVNFGEQEMRVPAGAALLARRTGADLRVALLRFDGDAVAMEVTDPVGGGSAQEMMQQVTTHFHRAAVAHPTSWLMLKSLA